jgi:hypothetical protein
MNSKLNAMNREFLSWIGAKPHMRTKVQMDNRENFIVAGMIRAAEISHASISEVLVAYKDKGGASMRYIGYIMERSAG